MTRHLTLAELAPRLTAATSPPAVRRRRPRRVVVVTGRRSLERGPVTRCHP